MKALLLIAALKCGVPTVVNRTAVWNNEDRLVLKTAVKRCGELFEDAPCVKKFIKTEIRVYRVICGGKK